MAEAEILDGSAAPNPGEMAARVATHDWSRTSLGPMSSWPQSLRTAAGICLDSGFPMLVCWGPDLVMLYNDGYIPVLGVKHPAALGQPLLECWSEIREMLRPMFQGVIESGRAVYASDLMFPLGRRGFTEECYFTFSYSPIRDESERVAGVLVTCTETTRRVIGERRLRTLRDLAARASEAKTDADAWRGAREAMAQNALGLPFVALYSLDATGATARRKGVCGLPTDSPAAPKAIDVQGDGAGWPVRLAAEGRIELVPDLRRRFGDLRGPVWPEPIEAALVLPITRPALPRPYGLLMVGLSPRLELDGDYRSFLELVAEHVATAVANARAYDEERKRAQSLAELDRAKTAFFGNVSHEFRTPLTLMLAPLDDLLRDADRLDPRDREELAVVRRNGQRLLKLVNTLLDFSRIEAGRVQASYEPTDLAAVTADLASVFRSAIERAGLQLTVDCEPPGTPVFVDRDMWEKIVFNLLSNAFKFTLQGRIAVRVRDRGDAVELRVEDTGAGIPAHELPRLFERFHRVEGARGRTQEGTGIGLALVQELIEFHLGTVAVDSTPGAGSTFTLSLPTDRDAYPPERLDRRRGKADVVVDRRDEGERAKLAQLIANPAELALADIAPGALPPQP
ncbi:MAG: ATP-binding protein, partial [Myxococcales bacterium]